MPAAVQRPGIGVEGLVYALLNESTDVSGGTATYQTIKALAATCKIAVNPNGAAFTDWADDGPAFVGTTTGKIQLDLEMMDILPTSLAEVLGSSYANGILSDGALDTAPYIALGYKQWLGGLDSTGAKVYRYKWLMKGKIAKPNEGGTTKKEGLAFEHMMLKGEFTRLNSNLLYQNTIRTDDPNVLAATVSAWFSSVTLSNSADLTAFTVVAAAGAGATGTFLLTFSKASASGSIPFALTADVIAAMANTIEVLKVSDGSLVAATYALLSAGTGFSSGTVTVRGTTTAGNIAVYINAPVAPGLVDGSGVALTAYHSGSVTLHA